MTKGLPFTQASICRAIRAAQAAGLRVTGIAADGTVLTTLDNGEVSDSVSRGEQLDPFVVGAGRVHAKAPGKRHVHS